MKLRCKILGTLLLGATLTGVISCGSGTLAPFAGVLGIASVEIVNCPQSDIALGQQKTLLAKAFDANGNEVSGASITFTSSQPRFASISTDGTAQAIYPGKAELVASAEGIDSPVCALTAATPAHQARVRQLTDNNVEDNWGMNNNWKTLSRGRVLFQQYDGINRTVFLHDLMDAPGNDALLNTTSNDVDFMALGSGAAGDDVLATWREGLSNTLVSPNGGAPNDLGAQFQEENSVADGLLLFRKGLPFNDIQSYSANSGLNPLASDGDLSYPIASEGRAVWLEDLGAGSFDLVYFDGQNLQPIVTGPFGGGGFDFRNGRIVYTSGNDIFLYDALAPNPQPKNITRRPQDLNRAPKTDGDSILFLRSVNGSADQEIVLYDIATDTETVISTTNDPKDPSSLQVDLKQALWVEGATLFFHDGSGDAAGTVPVALGNAALDTAFHPYLSDGAAAWVANDGNDDEIFVLE